MDQDNSSMAEIAGVNIRHHTEITGDGGAAFPKPDVWMPNHEQLSYGENGMTLRDWYAGMALIGILPSPRSESSGSFLDDYSHRQRAEFCYQQADAMLKARAA